MMHAILISAIAVFCYMVAFYLLANLVRNYSIVDIGWGPGFILICLVLTLSFPQLTDRSRILFILVTLWAARLSGHIFIRNIGKAEDFRYAAWRKDWGKKAPLISFFKIFMLQGLVMLVLALPLISAFAANPTPLTVVNIAGIFVFAAGFLYEAIADYQLASFKKKKENAGKIITVGVWSTSRHPNYFGEALLWWGLWMVSTGGGQSFYTWVSPLAITLLLRFVTGVPMLEEKYRSRPDFSGYASHTPAFIPFIGKKGL